MCDDIDGKSLVRRAAQGLCDVHDAKHIDGLLRRLDIYEDALNMIATHGDARSAIFAARVMSGDQEALDEPWQ